MRDGLEVRCPECGVEVSRLPPCRVCGYRWGCCPCVHAEEGVAHEMRETGLGWVCSVCEWDALIPYAGSLPYHRVLESWAQHHGQALTG